MYNFYSKIIIIVGTIISMTIDTTSITSSTDHIFDCHMI